VEADCVLAATGRKPVLDSWGREAAGLAADSRGMPVDERMRTAVPGIWAAGDLTGRSLLAHSAYRMAETAAEDIAAFLDSASGGTGEDRPGTGINWDAIPWAVYGITEAAGVGLTSEETQRRGLETVKVSLPTRLSGRFAAENSFAGQGAVKIIAEAAGRRVLGIHAVGSYAPEFIWGGALIIEKEMTLEEVRRVTFPHPTVCELIGEAARTLE
jgi:dihydrolipoamide dehydrogenase